MSRIGITEAAAKASKMVLKRPTATEILWMNLAVTYLCNGRCRMCGIWKRYRQDPSAIEQELSLTEIEALLSSKHARNVQGISLTGGEPFLRKDFVDLAGLCIQRFPNAFISIATNGLSPGLILRKTRDIVQRYEPRLLSLSVSLDGIGDAHDGIRGVNGAYSRVLRTVKSLTEETNVNVGLDFTITPWNYDQVWDAYQLSKKLGVKFIAVFAHNSDSYYGNTGLDLDCGDARSEASRLVHQVAADRARHESMLEKLIDPYVCFMTQAARNAEEDGAEYLCHSGTHSLFLDPYGDVYPCILLDKKLGNVRDEPLDDLWLSSRALEVRDYIERERCQCWVACETVPSLLRGLAVPRWNLMNKFLKPMVSALSRDG